jgi:hypothetical protein
MFQLIGINFSTSTTRFHQKIIKIDDLAILRIDKFVKHMWINRWNPHTIGKSSKQINDTCTK